MRIQTQTNANTRNQISHTTLLFPVSFDQNLELQLKVKALLCSRGGCGYVLVFLCLCLSFVRHTAYTSHSVDLFDLSISFRPLSVLPVSSVFRFWSAGSQRTCVRLCLTCLYSTQPTVQCPPPASTVVIRARFKRC